MKEKIISILKWALNTNRPIEKDYETPVKYFKITLCEMPSDFIVLHWLESTSTGFISFSGMDDCALDKSEWDEMEKLILEKHEEQKLVTKNWKLKMIDEYYQKIPA